MRVHDLVGIGFGPSNLALAIALDEQRSAGPPVDALFIERQNAFAWHPDMLLSHAHMQISFLKDLATLRNPTSRYTFVNYLHEQRRLQDFINLKTFYPSRREFNDYLRWAAAQFHDACLYGHEVVDVLPEQRGREVELLRVRSRDAAGALHDRLARHLVVSVGGAANVPPAFRGLRGDPRVLHSSRYLSGIARLPDARRIAIVGAGQSAAELFIDLHGSAGAPRIDLVMRSSTIKPSDDSPFVNEIFNAEFVDGLYARPEAERRALLREFRHTNYACPDLELIRQIFKVFYDQRVSGDARHRLLRRHEVQSARAAPDGIHLNLLDVDASREHAERYDAVLLATGYVREQHQALLGKLTPWLGRLETDRDYRVHAPRAFRPAVFLQGACETTHGLSDTLLSITAVRSDEIGRALLRAASPPAAAPKPRPLRCQPLES